MVSEKNHLLFLVDNPEKNGDLIGKLHSLKNTTVTRIRNMRFEQMRNFLVNHRNCIVVLLIEDRHGKAVDLLYRLHNCSFNSPYVVAVVKIEPSRFVEHLKVHNVSKFFDYNDKNYSSDLVISWIEKIYRALSMASIFPVFRQHLYSSVRLQIVTRLENMGMLLNLTGHKYVVDAIELCIEDPSLGITRDIYWILAKRYKTTYSSVDRCMRHAIEIVWRDTSMECLKKYYPDTDRVYKMRPSVSEFVKCIAEDMSMTFPSVRRKFDGDKKIS